MAKTKWKKPKIFEAFENNRLITIHDRKCLIMEGCESIVFCDRDKIILQGKLRLEILGVNLALKELGNENMAVVGKINSVVFEG